MVFDQKSLRAYKKKFNFFETPEELADLMAEQLLGAISWYARVLEPSAGLGALIKAVQRKLPFLEKPVEYCELQSDFCAVLDSIGARKVCDDFEKYSPGAVYNAIIMNPPYRDGTACKHVCRAWNALAPGGTIVALLDKNSAEKIVESFLEEVHDAQNFPRGTFKETNVETVMLTINKPLY